MYHRGKVDNHDDCKVTIKSCLAQPVGVSQEPGAIFHGPFGTLANQEFLRIDQLKLFVFPNAVDQNLSKPDKQIQSDYKG